MIKIKTVKCDLGNFDEITIHTFADWHIGDAACNMREIRNEIEYVRSHDNAFVIMNGDLCNNAIKTSVSDSYAEILTPQDQIDFVVDLLEPVKDKILMINSGNHEERTYKNDGIDLSAIIASRLGKLHAYCDAGGVCFVRFGRDNKGRPVRYSIYATHGRGGGRKEGAKAIRLADMASIVDVDAYLHSHTHLPMIMKEAFWRVSNTTSSVSKVDKVFINSGSKLDYGGYGQRYEFKPSSLANPVLILSGKARDMKAMM